MKHLAIPVAVLAMSCGPQPEVRVHQAQKAWIQANIRNYEFTYSAGGFAHFPPTRITVRDGEAVLATMIDSGEIVPGMTIESLFAQVEGGPKSGRSYVSFDPQLGYPTRAYFDGGQEGWGFNVDDFEQLD